MNILFIIKKMLERCSSFAPLREGSVLRIFKIDGEEYLVVREGTILQHEVLNDGDIEILNGRHLSLLKRTGKDKDLLRLIPVQIAANGTETTKIPKGTFYLPMPEI